MNLSSCKSIWAIQILLKTQNIQCKNSEFGFISKCRKELRNNNDLLTFLVSYLKTFRIVKTAFLKVVNKCVCTKHPRLWFCIFPLYLPLLENWYACLRRWIKYKIFFFIYYLLKLYIKLYKNCILKFSNC